MVYFDQIMHQMLITLEPHGMYHFTGNYQLSTHSCKNGHCRVLRKQYYFNAQCAIVPVMSTEGISYQMKTF